jgi:hypothetical protein
LFKVLISYFLFGVLLLPPVLEILPLANGHMDKHFFYENDLNINSDDQFCLFEFNLNNESLVLNKNYKYNFHVGDFYTIEINKIIFYSKNYFTLTKRGPPIA